MISFLVKKVLIFLASLWVVVTLTFALIQIIPGDPFTQERAVPEEILQAMYRHYGLDQPWYVQYGKYLKGVVTFDFGPSFKYQGRSATDIIKEGFPVSMVLGLEALCLSIASGIILGCVAALRHTKWQDHFAMVFSALGISVPSFILATFLQYFFSMKLDLFPIARWGSIAHSVLPAIALATLPTAFIARLTRSNMLDTMHQDYIQTARSKGLGEVRIVWRHALRNTLLPIITYLGPLTTSILTGSFAVEKIFGIPGIGQWFVMSITNRDYTVIMATTIFYSVILMLCVFFVDLTYCLIDPRIRPMSKKKEAKA